ncbi:MAG TPA: serine hydrolase [Candidatus Tumulicola sp.]|jgi:CubicO group peptidase (beta-lactamase class C family)
MKRWTSVILAAAFAMSLAPCAAGAAAPASPQEIQRSLDAFVATAPGAVVIVGLVDHGVTHIYQAGTPPPGAPPLDASTEFQIGSITKTFTATLLAEMVLSGKVHLDDPIGKYLPAGLHPPAYDGRQITLLNLAEQNSGLPEMPTNFAPANPSDPYADYGTARLYDFLGGYALTRAPGARFEYSNLGVGLLGTLLANAAHTDYASLVRSGVLEPLGMNETSAGITPQIRARLMPGFTQGLTPSPAWTLTGLAGAGAINSSMHDMLLYLKANMNAPSGRLGAAMAFAQKPRSDTALAAFMKIGLNWFTNVNSHVTWHNGQTGGYHAFIGFDRAGGTGIVVLANVAQFRADDLAIHLLAPEANPTSAVIATPPPAVLPHGKSPYVGVYQLAPTFSITIFEDDGILYGQATKQPQFELTLQSGTTYSVTGVDATITFVLDSAGHATSLVLHQNGLNMPGTLVKP